MNVASPLVLNETHLVWLDMEMTGLSPFTDRILEVAVVVTDSLLEVVAEGPTIAVHQSDEVLQAMDAWNQKMHGRSGLIERVRASAYSEEHASTEIVAFLQRYVPKGKSPLCGNSICQDRRFMASWMPELEAFFHYRHIDVSTLKELCKRWRPDIAKGFAKEARHTALADVYESIEELRHYRTHFLKLEVPES